MTTIKKTSITCPTCQAKDTWKPDNEFRPFCSYRCKLIDLGEWADGARAIPGDPAKMPTSDEDEED